MDYSGKDYSLTMGEPAPEIRQVGGGERIFRSRTYRSRIDNQASRKVVFRRVGTSCSYMGTPIPKEAEALLQSEPLIAHLGTCHESIPHVAPLWYNYRDGIVEIATTGRKLENIRRNPHVALSVQKDQNGHPRWGVVCQGEAEIVDDNEESVLARINRKYGADDDAWSDNTPVQVTVGSVDYWIY